MYRAAINSLEKNKIQLLTLPNVVGVGIGYKTVHNQRTERIALIVFVEKKAALNELNQEHIIPRSLDSVTTDVIEIGKVRLFSPTEKIRPAKPGVSISHYLVSAGTFGAVVIDKETGKKLILSNNHVLANATNGRDKKSAIGDPILQPGNYDGGNLEDQMATLERFIPLIREEEEPTCTWALRLNSIANRIIKFFKPQYQVKIVKKGVENTVDCAVAMPIKEEYINDEISEIGKINGINTVRMGLPVKKSGRSSGLTKGYVIATDVSLKVDVTPGEICFFSDQIVCDIESLPGDSGSLILDEENKAVGLLFAGSEQFTIANKIQNVLKALNIDLKY